VSSLKDVLNLVLKSPEAQADMVYDFIRRFFGSEGNIKYGIKILLIAIKKHPDMIDYLRKADVVITNVLRSVEGGKSE